MILYEVNLSVDAAIAEEHEAWLIPHIEEIVSIDGVTGARWYRVDADGTGGGATGGAGRVLWCVHYLMADRAAYESYIANHADRLRQDAVGRFGTRFTATRRVMERAGETGFEGED